MLWIFSNSFIVLRLFNKLFFFLSNNFNSSPNTRAESVFLILRIKINAGKEIVLVRNVVGII